MTESEARALLERRRRAWLAEDLPAYMELCDDRLEFRSPLHVEPVRGKENYEALVRGALAAFRPVRFDLRALAVAGDRVLAEWTIEVERRDDGRRAAWDGMASARVRDGRIVFWREYWNADDLRVLR